MNNLNNFVELDKISSQLKRVDKKKNRLFRSIYREYELYLNLLRDLLYISVKNGIDKLSTYPSIKNSILDANQISFFFKEKIRPLIYAKLPLFTIEQLKINKIENKINPKINPSGLVRISDSNDNQKEKYQHKDEFQFVEPLNFDISDNIFNTSEYYRTENDEKLVSLDLDNNNSENNLSKNHILENLSFEKQFITSFLELIREVNVENPRNFDDYNICKKDRFPNHQNLKDFDLVDYSLENLLINISYMINQELFNASLIKKMISQDSFEFCVGKKLMVKHPYPFVINFELNINQSLSKGDNFQNIVFFNMSTVELEFYNLSLSIQRNKINELKNQFQGLIKKERYWKKKELSLNKFLEI